MEDLLTQLANMDWADIAAYSALVAGAAGTVGALFSQTFYYAWKRVEAPVRFVVSTLVLFTLWYSTLRIHWYSALLYTPVYLLTYRLEKLAITAASWIFEMFLDLVILSWMPEIAERNRIKWRTRIGMAWAGILRYTEKFSKNTEAA